MTSEWLLDRKLATQALCSLGTASCYKNSCASAEEKAGRARRTPEKTKLTWHFAAQLVAVAVVRDHPPAERQQGIRNRLRQEGELRTQQQQEAVAAKRKAAADKRAEDNLYDFP